MEQQADQSIEQLYTPRNSSGGNTKRIIVIVLILILIGAASFGGYKIISSKSDKSDSEKITPTPTVALLPTDTPTPTATPSPSLKQEATPTQKPTSTPTSKPTQNPLDKTSGLDRSKLSIEVLNGSGVTGAAKKAADTLKELGYNIASTDNADSDTYDKTVISVKSVKSNYLALLKKDLQGSYTIGSTSSDLAASSSADARVIVGKQ